MIHDSVTTRTVQKMAFKGTITLFAVRNVGIKLQKHKGPV
jgi:hypothetical protein